MLLQNEIEVALGLDDAWSVLTDLERVAPCLPGAALDGRDGDRYEGSVKIKVGPIGAHFQGTAELTERDAAAHRAVIHASGKDLKGQSTATAEVRAQLEAIDSGRTRVVIDTELDISGRMAQFGRGAIADVSHRLLSQFADNLAAEVGAPPLLGVSTPVADRSAPREASADLDVMSLVVPMVKERYGQALLGGLIGVVLSWLLFGRRARR